MAAWVAAKAPLAWVAAKDTALAIVNLIALDTFLYEESTYNFFGHANNVLKQERNMGAAFEIAIAGFIALSVYKQYRAIGRTPDEDDARAMV